MKDGTRILGQAQEAGLLQPISSIARKQGVDEHGMAVSHSSVPDQAVNITP